MTTKKIGIPLELDRKGPPGLIIVGRTGAGKSTLVNSIFGYNVAKTGTRSDVTEGVERYKLPKTGVTIFDTPGAGGLNDDAESAMRNFLQLDIPSRKRKPIAADVVVFVISHDRPSKLDVDFFKEVDAVYGPRMILVKNYKADETPEDFRRNLTEIEARCSRKPIPVDAKNATGVENLIAEIFRLLPSERVLDFNRELQAHRAKARAMARRITAKYASLAAVSRSGNKKEVSDELESLRKGLQGDIARAFIDDLELGGYGDKASALRRTVVSEDVSDNAKARGGAGVIIGGLLGLVLGPAGALFGAFLGGLLGTASTPERWRGGAVAVVDTVVYGRGLTDLLDEGLRDPVISLTYESKRMKVWLEQKKHVFEGRLMELRNTIERAADQEALVAFLNSPNTEDPAVVEAKIEPLVEAAFETRPS